MIDFNSDAKEEEVALNWMQNPFSHFSKSPKSTSIYPSRRRRRRRTKRRRRMMGRTYRFCWTRPTFRQAAPIYFTDLQQLKCFLTNLSDIVQRVQRVFILIPSKDINGDSPEMAKPLKKNIDISNGALK